MIMIIHHSATKAITAAAASSATTTVCRPQRHFKVKLSAINSTAVSPVKHGTRCVKRSHDDICYGCITFLEHGPSHHPNSMGAFHPNTSKKARYSTCETLPN